MQLYTSDKLLPAAPVLLDSPSLGERLRKWLGPADLRIVNIRYKPNTSCLVTYVYECDGKKSFIHAKAFRKDDWSIRSQKIMEPAWIDSDLAFAAFKFPQDSKLESIRELFNDSGRFLSRVLLDDDFESVTKIETLAYKPNRRFVGAVQFNNGAKSVLRLHCKSSYKQSLAAAATIKKLQINRVPKRIGRSKRYRALAYEWIDGAPFSVVGLDPSDVSSTAEQVIEFLNQFQRPINTRKFSVAVRSPVGGLAEIADYLEMICSPLGIIANKLFQRIATDRPADYVPRLAHGDFYDRQLLDNAGSLLTCDFDDLCVDDSTVDVSNFVAHLKYRKIVGTIGSEVANEFDEQFKRMMNSKETNPQHRYLWNQSVALMRLSTHPFRAGDPNWFEKTERILDEVKQILARLQSAQNGKYSPGGSRVNPHSLGTDNSLGFLSHLGTEKSSKILQKNTPKLSKRFGKFSVISTKIARHKFGRRCMIEFDLATDSGTRTVLGKVSAKRTNTKAENIQRLLHKNHGFNSKSNDRICTPRTYGCFKPWQMWIQQKVDGRTAGELMESGRFPSIIERIAPAIHKLHHSGFQPPRTHTIQDEIKILKKRLGGTRNLLPDHSRRIENVLKSSMKVAECFVGRLPMAPIHRDFYQDQILFSEDLTYLIDLDLVASGPPALDIGNFLAHLTEHGIRVHGDPFYWQQEESQIAIHWLSLNDNSTQIEVARFKAISFARHISISHSIKCRRNNTAEILDHAELLLAQILESPTGTINYLDRKSTGELI